jgi:DNA polymerase-1
MLTIRTNELSPEALFALDADVSDWVYNGLDCMVTDEVLEVVLPECDDVTRRTYEFSKALQAPILEMNMRGVLIDQGARDEAIDSMQRDMLLLEDNLERLCRDGIGYDLGRSKEGKLGWASPKKVQTLFYEVMGLPPIKKRNQRGEMVPTSDRAALEKLQVHFLAEPIIKHMLALRDLGKRVGTLQTEIDGDGRMRTSYNIAGTDTGRLSSSLADFGTGTNLQNIDPRLRKVFIADPGYKLANIDLEQGDSRNVGFLVWSLFGDPGYLDACESGDLHTAVSRMSWPSLGWNGDPAFDRRIADQRFYREFSYRDMAKRLGHGTNYLGTPRTMAAHTKVPVATVGEFQSQYFTAFPGIQRWHGWVTNELVTRGCLTTPFGRRRYFFGRRTEDSTLRAAIAFTPQSMTADEIDLGLLNVWRLNRVQLLLQVHDSITIQYREEEEDEIIPLVLRTLIEAARLEARGREFVVPADCKVGWNWGNFDDSNPDGLRKWKGTDPRRRTRPAATGILHRRIF